MSKPTLMVSFSGGRTSAFMARWLQLNKPDDFNLVFVFMNTGAEHEATLEFVNECDRRWGLNVAWLEADVSPEKGKGTSYKIASFETASRSGQPFIDVCRKYGVPNAGFPHCNREMKLKPFEKYRADFYPGSQRAIGIRADEFDRIVVNYEQLGIVYPLIKWRYTTKPEILRWWSEQDFNLMIPEHMGNCVTCWKKSDRKLYTVNRELPGAFELFDKIENDPLVIAANQEKNSGKFFRSHRATRDVVREAGETLAGFRDPYFSMISDDSNGCSDSCEVFGGDQLDMFA